MINANCLHTVCRSVYIKIIALNENEHISCKAALYDIVPNGFTTVHGEEKVPYMTYGCSRNTHIKAVIKVVNNLQEKQCYKTKIAP